MYVRMYVFQETNNCPVSTPGVAQPFPPRSDEQVIRPIADAAHKENYANDNDDVFSAQIISDEKVANKAPLVDVDPIESQAIHKKRNL